MKETLQSERSRQRRGRSSISQSFFLANRVVWAVVCSQIEPVRAPRGDQGRQIEPARAPGAARSSQSEPDRTSQGAKSSHKSSQEPSKSVAETPQRHSKSLRVSSQDARNAVRIAKRGRKRLRIDLRLIFGRFRLI